MRTGAATQQTDVGQQQQSDHHRTEQAGLKPSEGGIDLSLRDPGQQAGGRQQQGDEAPRGRRAWVEASEDSALVTDVASLPRNASRLGGVDLSI